MESPRPWLSVITVVRDAPAAFADTVRSLALQSDQAFEFVVVDSSNDRESTCQTLSGRPHRYTWTSPEGIYPAMNIGLEQAIGEYVYFLNAGDTLHDRETLRVIRPQIMSSLPPWAFGRIEIFNLNGTRTLTPLWDYRAHKKAHFARGHFPAHQGTFVRRDLLVALGGFDTRYRIAADYAAFLELSKQADPLVLETVIADFAEGGASTTNWRASFIEFHQARMEAFSPRGFQALREYGHTVWQIASVGLYRSFWSWLGQH